MKSNAINPSELQSYIQAGHFIEETFADLWQRNAQQYPGSEAIADSNTRLTWWQANRAIDRIAFGLLELGFKRDEVIVLQLPNIVEAMLTRIALSKCGLIAFPVVMGLRESELIYAIQSSRAAAVIIVKEFRQRDYFQTINRIRSNVPSLRHIILADDDIAGEAISIKQLSQQPLEEKYSANYLQKLQVKSDEVIEFRMTSGTTGFPKITMIGANGPLLFGKTAVKRLKITHNDVLAALATIFGGGAGLSWEAAPFAASKVVLLERFDAEQALELLSRENVTIALGVPTQMAMMLRHPSFSRYQFLHLRAFVYSGAPCTIALAEEFEQKTGCRVVANYGAQDVGLLCSATIDSPPDVRHKSVGKPVPGLEIKFINSDGNTASPLDGGELLCKGPTCTSAYYEKTIQPTENSYEGWRTTGDICKLDRKGNLYIIGRAKEAIIRGGQNIYPKEIESLLAEHTKIASVAVIPIPDPVMGERACACVILKPAESLTFEDMVSFLKRKNIASYKLPEMLKIKKEFPMLADGQKVDKRRLSEEIMRKVMDDHKIVK